MRVLLIEDEEMNLQLYEAGLENNQIPFSYIGQAELSAADVADATQINVVIATTLRDARQALEGATWDIVISDLKFPEQPWSVVGIHGITMVTEALRQGVRKVYLNTASLNSISEEVPAGVIVLPEKLTYKTLVTLLQQEAA